MSIAMGRAGATVGVLVVGAVIGSCVGRQGSGESRRTATPNDSTRVARVERGLLPAVAVRGRPDASYVLADRMQRYGVPGVCVAVIDGGRVAWARAYGTLESGGTRSVDTTTLFQAGSISKAVTAVAALRCVERGLLRLDEDVNARLVGWRIPANP